MTVKVGLLHAAVVLSANTYADIYKPASGNSGVFTLCICNRNATSATYIFGTRTNGSANAAPDSGTFKASGVSIPANTTVFVSGLTLTDTQTLVAQASQTLVDFSCDGREGPPV